MSSKLDARPCPELPDDLLELPHGDPPGPGHGPGGGGEVGAGGVGQAARRTLAPLTDKTLGISLGGAPEQGPDHGGGGPGGQGRHWGREADDGVGGHGAVRGGGGVVTKVRHQGDVLTRGLLVDAAPVLRPLMAVAECGFTRLAGPGTADCHTGRGGWCCGGG